MYLNKLRLLIQAIFASLTNSYLDFFNTKHLYQGALKSACVPFLNCQTCPSALFSCPVGIMQHFMTLHKIPYTLLGFLSVIGIICGAMPCGWLCPFGWLQDVLYKIKSIKIKIPEQLNHIRYFILLFFVILIPILTQETFFSKFCPVGTLEAALPWVIWNPIDPLYNTPVVSPLQIDFYFIVRILILIAFIVFFIFSKRPFCRIFCPLGVFLGFLNKYCILRFKIEVNGCKNCNQCKKDCPVDLKIIDNPNASTCVRCFNCLKCEHVKIGISDFEEKKL